MFSPAIVVVAYNRADSLQRLLNSLAKAEYPGGVDVPLIISIDYSGDDACQKVANSFVWKYGAKRVVAHEVNLGLRAHVLECGQYTGDFGSIIVLEDDLIVAKGFYDYAQHALEYVSHDNRIASVSLYSHRFNVHVREPFEPLDDGSDNWYFGIPSSWGQAYTKEMWDNFVAWYEQHKDEQPSSPFVPEFVCSWSDSSWLKYYIWYMTECNLYSFNPRYSFTTNFSEIGTHAIKSEPETQVPLSGKSRGAQFRFESLDDSKCVYDAFFENIRIRDAVAEQIDVLPGNVLVDLYGYKDIHGLLLNGVRFVISSGLYPYKVLKSFARALKPIDANIVYDIAGEDLFVYDTAQSAEAPDIKESVMTAQKTIYNYPGLSADRMVKLLKYRTSEKLHK